MVHVVAGISLLIWSTADRGTNGTNAVRDYYKAIKVKIELAQFHR